MPNQTLEFGSARVTSLVDARPQPVDPAWSFPEVPSAAWKEERGSLDQDDRFAPNLGCFLLQLPQANILIDAGIGPGPDPYLKGLCGNLPARLAETGVGPDEIDFVLFTHLHMDHVGWAARSTADGATHPYFSRARYLAVAAECGFWLSTPDAGEHHLLGIERSIRPLAEAGRLERVEIESFSACGLSFMVTPGHTPHHASVRLNAGDHTLVITGDVLHCPAQVTHPNWCHRADMAPTHARQTRCRFIREAAAEGWLLAAGHFRDGWQFGRIVETHDRFRWEPVGA